MLPCSGGKIPSRIEPPSTCRKCARLVAFRHENKRKYPEFHNAPVMTWGASDAPLLIVGLAPGLKGANRTGRPFTGDASGDLLFESLFRLGLASKEDDETILLGCAITNAIACVPPQNRPIGEEVANCRGYLAAKLTFPRTVLVLGKVAHDSVLKAMGVRLTGYRFSHGAVTQIAGKKFVSSFHPSRYNVATKRINTEMMDAIIRECLKP